MGGGLRVRGESTRFRVRMGQNPRARAVFQPKKWRGTSTFPIFLDSPRIALLALTRPDAKREIRSGHGPLTASQPRRALPCGLGETDSRLPASEAADAGGS